MEEKVELPGRSENLNTRSHIRQSSHIIVTETQIGLYRHFTIFAWADSAVFPYPSMTIFEDLPEIVHRKLLSNRNGFVRVVHIKAHTVHFHERRLTRQASYTKIGAVIDIEIVRSSRSEMTRLAHVPSDGTDDDGQMRVRVSVGRTCRCPTVYSAHFLLACHLSTEKHYLLRRGTAYL